MHPLNKVRLCLGLNVFLLALVATCVCVFASNGAYFRFGPSSDFVLIGVPINTSAKYVILLCLIALMDCIKVLVAELGEPVLVFNVYNPDKRTITDFTRSQLLMYANLMFFVSNTRRVFEVMITVTQIDIALFSICFEQLVSVCTVCVLVREKRFDVPMLSSSSGQSDDDKI